MESSDDEMNLLGPAYLAGDATSASHLMSDEEMDDDEEVLTSDAEELAELAANRSLEKYLAKVGHLSPVIDAGSNVSFQNCCEIGN
jgi:hypothetical protein